jgi:hypothetical protein
MIFAVVLIALHDFLLSNALAWPLALQNSPIAQVRALDRVASSLEFLVPVIIFCVMFILWLTGRNAWVYRSVIIFLSWVTLRLTLKVVLVLLSVISRPPNGVSGLLTDTIILWFVNVLIFGIWYWIIDGGGPCVRRAGRVKRFDFAFPQHTAPFLGWENWRSRFWDYLFLGFYGSTQFGLGDVCLLSVRSKLLLMLHVTLSMSVVIFIASVALGLLH